MAYRLFEPGNEVTAIVFLFETREGHLSARDVLEDTGVDDRFGRQKSGTYLLGVLQILKQRVLVPSNTFSDVGGRI